MTETSGIRYPVQTTRTCIKCRKDLPANQFTNAGNHQSLACDICINKWRAEQIAKGNKGGST